MMRFVFASIFLISGHYSDAQDTTVVGEFGWLTMFVDSIENESNLCQSCTSVPEFRSYIVPNGLRRFRFRYQCGNSESGTIHFEENGSIVGLCIVDSISRNCEDGPAFTAYTFGRDITVIWTCTDGFDCKTTPSSILFGQYSVQIRDGLCEKNIKTLSVSSSFDAYQWKTPDGIIVTSKELQADIPGQYELIVFEENGCPDTSYIEVDPSVINELQISGPTIICDDHGIQLSLPGYEQYLWSTGASEDHIEVFSPGAYSVSVSNASGCQDTAMIIIRDGQDQQVFIEGGDEPLYEGQSKTFSLTFSDVQEKDVLGASWTIENEQPIEGFTLSILIDEPFNLSVSVETDSGCLLEDDIYVDPLPVNRHLYIPNVFYPMSASGNGLFMLQSIEGTIDLSDLTIYDRWGAPVYINLSPVINDKNESWDGYKNGQLLPAGIYIYSVEVSYADGTKEIKKRYCTLDLLNNFCVINP